MQPLKIGKYDIGPGKHTFIIAEGGVNHNGDPEIAKKLIDAAKDCGADAIKFQIFITEKEITRHADKAEYQKETTGKGETQFDMVKKLELKFPAFKELQDYANKKGIIFICSAFDFASLDYLNSIGVPAFKFGSGEITNFPLLEHAAKMGKPVILATGMATLGEIEEAVILFQRYKVPILLFHCITSYPAPVDECNLNAIKTIQDAFQIPTGLSDHTMVISVPTAAVAMGACSVEKHFTLDNDMVGPDHKASLNPKNFKAMVDSIRDIEKARGNGLKVPQPVEWENRKLIRKSIVAEVAIPKGTVITREMLEFKRPGTGLQPRDLALVIGKKAKRDIKPDELFTWEDLIS